VPLKREQNSNQVWVHSYKEKDILKSINKFIIKVLNNNIKDLSWKIKLKSWSSHSISWRLWWSVAIRILNYYQMQQLYKWCNTIQDSRRSTKLFTKDQSVENLSYHCWHEKPRWFASWRFDEDWMKLFWTILKPLPLEWSLHWWRKGDLMITILIKTGTCALHVLNHLESVF